MFRFPNFDKLQFLFFSEIRPNLDILHPYTMSEPLPHPKLSWEFSDRCNENPISSLISEWEPMNTALGVHQIQNFLGFVAPVPPPTPLHQIQHFQELVHLVQNTKFKLFVGCPKPPKYQIGRPPGRLIGGVWGGRAPPGKIKNHKLNQVG